MRIVIVLLFLLNTVYGYEPVQPIPKKIKYDREKAELGKLLFHDPILSKDNRTSCSYCHDLYNKCGTDHRPVAKGFHDKEGKINTPTVFNVVFNFRFFWDGRAKSLKEQIYGPIQNPIEMNMKLEEVVQRLEKHPIYRKKFKKIYKTDKIRFDMVADAIAEFEKALITPNSKFDRFLRGEVKLSEKEMEGYKLFKKLGCITCHNGINLGGNSFQKVGVVKEYPWKPDNPDRYRITKNEFDKNVYRVPTLRNIDCTYPYYHDGSIKTLEEAVQDMAYYNLGFRLTEEELEKIIAFLKTLRGELPEILRGDTTQ
ncbi:cytochrome c peroxidase [Persephonella hydrogeniphila]|uniref:Cytochrome c peroxidase n=1 Tax=Persephonella hydrogeniphila TaxID=198703 RepID=A0A285NRD5_9AQUI|nr:cytochrome c peroxidase [Persephonella hydrogeniphila]SNZ10191.1 cytochrome c peroxidase [Persephonella hydrogeniphila]